jgi:hypothetical protein
MRLSSSPGAFRSLIQNLQNKNYIAETIHRRQRRERKKRPISNTIVVIWTPKSLRATHASDRKFAFRNGALTWKEKCVDPGRPSRSELPVQQQQLREHNNYAIIALQKPDKR